MPGQDEHIDPTEFMTDTQRQAHEERQRENAKAFAMLSQKNQQLIRELEERQEQEVLRRIAAAVAEEREACAQVALGVQINETSLCAEWGRQCAAAIRRRGIS